MLKKKLLICSHNEASSSFQNLCFLLLSFLHMFLPLFLPKRDRYTLGSSEAPQQTTLKRLLLD